MALAPVLGVGAGVGVGAAGVGVCVGVGALVTCLASSVVLRSAVGAPRPRLPRPEVIALGAAAAVVALRTAPALVPVAVAVVVAVPRVSGRFADHRERRTADAELPEALESVARALRAGASLGQAVADAPVPRAPSLRDEWLRLRAAVPSIGVAAAVDAVWRPVPSRQLVAGALRLAADVGGPQARALDLAAATLRQRLAFHDEVRAQSAQARASALVVAGAPLAFAVLAAATDPRYVPFLVHTVPGALLLYAGLALDALGLAWMTHLGRAAGGRGGSP